MAEEPNPSPPGSGASLPATAPGAALGGSSGTPAAEDKTIPELSDLYRQLLDELTASFGGKLDETNADAIAYAAAELYHRHFEPRLWQEKSTHDLLDLFGVPRAGSFAPYSLTERVLIFQRRATQTEYVTRAHELLSALGVPRQDEEGTDQSLKWRLERFLESWANPQATDGDDHVDGQTGGGETTPSADAQEEDAVEVAGNGARGSAADNPVTVGPRHGTPEKPALGEEATGPAGEEDSALAPVAPAGEDTGLAEPEPADTGLVDEADTGLARREPAEEVEPPDKEKDREGAEEGEAEEDREEAEGDEPKVEDREGAVEDRDGAVEDRDGAVEEEDREAEAEEETMVPDAEAKPAEGVEARGEAEEDKEAGRRREDEAREAGVDVDREPGAAPLVDAVKALEHAARVEAELAKQGPEAPAVAGAVDIERLTSTLSSVQAEMAALRTLVDTLGIEIRERLDILHEEILVAQGRLGPEPPPPTTVEPSRDTLRAADDVTRELPPVPLPTEAGAPEGAEGVAKRASRRVLLVVLLVLLGLIIAGAIVAVILVGWDQIRSQITGS